MVHASPTQHLDSTTTITLRFNSLRPPTWARELFPLFFKRGEVVRGELNLTDDPTHTTRRPPVAVTLGDNQKVTLTVAYQDAKGKPAAVDGDVTWASSDPTIATVSVPDPAHTETALIVAVAMGTAQITASANADMDPAGVAREVTVTGAITVTSGEAVSGTFTPGTVTTQ